MIDAFGFGWWPVCGYLLFCAAAVAASYLGD
jgi:hypothetical protein